MKFSHWHVWTFLAGAVVGYLFLGTIIGAVMGLFGGKG